MEANAKYTDRTGKTFDAIVESSYWTERRGSMENACNVAAAETTRHVAYNIRVAYPLAKKGMTRHAELMRGGAELADDWRPIGGIYEKADLPNPTGKAFLSLSDEVRAQFKPPVPAEAPSTSNERYGDLMPPDVAAVELERRQASFHDSESAPKKKNRPVLGG